jgi:hypothetical protein
MCGRACLAFLLGAAAIAMLAGRPAHAISINDGVPLALTSGGFGLSVNAMNATDVRTELGSRFDAPTLVYGRPLVFYGRVAWAHDFVDNPALSAEFQTLPGTNFTVFGAPIPHDSVLTTAGAKLFLAANWSLTAKFDGEFASARRPTPVRGRCATAGEV